MEINNKSIAGREYCRLSVFPGRIDFQNNDFVFRPSYLLRIRFSGENVCQDQVAFRPGDFYSSFFFAEVDQVAEGAG